jgi:hypothetical protein
VARPAFSRNPAPPESLPEGGGERADPVIRDTLAHLLEVEASARTLADEAQAEADRLVSEGEKRNRARYEERCAACAAELEDAYRRDFALISGEYQKQIDAYRAGLDDLHGDADAFNRAVERFLAAEN